MNIIENTKFMLSVCEMFYVEGLSQKEISKILDISRPQISRIIAKAKENKLVSIKINFPNKEENEYENRIRDAYGIPEVHIYDIGVPDAPEGILKLAEAARDLFYILVKSNKKVGIMTGKTVEAIAEAIEPSRNRNLEFIPLCGGFSSSGTSWYANSVCQNFAKKTNGNYYLFNAPNYLCNSQTKQSLLNEKSIQEIMEKGQKCDVAFLGIGSLSADSTGVLAEGLCKEDLIELRNQGAIANICCSYINEAGMILKSSIEDRILGQPITALHNCRKIGIALGRSKVRAIKAVLKGKLIDVLITSLDTAKDIIGLTNIKEEN
jgi:DNA-binding transcriptional regulator LsrR (DeoR family)